MNDRIRPDSRGLTGTVQTAIWTLSPGQMGRRGAQIVEALFSPRRALLNTQLRANKLREQHRQVDLLEARLADSGPVIDLVAMEREQQEVPDGRSARQPA